MTVRRYSTSTTVTKGQISVARIIIAFATSGLSLPFIGIRRRIGSSKVVRVTMTP